MTDPQNPNEPPKDPGDDTEKAFWEKLDERIDSGIQRAVEKFTKPSSTRNGGRKTIPEMIAEAMGGPFKPVK